MSNMLNWLTRHRTLKGLFSWNGVWLPYWVIDAKVDGLDHYMGFQDSIFFLSSNVPKEFRHACLYHEAQEYLSRCGQELQVADCLCATKAEMRFIAKWDSKEIHEYLVFRLNFFGDLISYYQGNAEMVDLVLRLKLSKQYIENLCLVRAWENPDILLQAL